ncbi:MAG: serine/threonine protein kinase [Planctomycetes bacterium]|nr:serine/threonine protein kinase [Planctomycetota bacterium]
MIASDDGLDTALARVLHEQDSVDMGSLQTVLAEVRLRRGLDPGLSLAVVLRERNLVSKDALETAFNTVGAEAGFGHAEALHALGLPPDIGPYRVVSELSRGGMGAIHEIVHEESGVSFALKTILPNIGERGGEELERFSREGIALGRLNHPNVVRVHAAFLTGPTPYLIQDLLPGGTLEARLDPAKQSVVADALEVTRKLGEGLAHAHERGVLHRDLKPLNVLFDDRDEPCLVDFGLVRFLSGSSLTQSGQLLGTPAYMAPEQAIGGTVDERADVYGLGGILFATLTGQPPFTGTGLGILAEVVQDPPPPPSRFNSNVPRWLDRVVAKALAKEPEERYPSVRALLAALASAQAPDAKPTLRTPILVGVALVALLAAGFVLRAASQERTRKQATDSIRSHLAPTSSAARFSTLASELAGWERVLAKDTPELLLAQGFVAIARDDPAAAQRAFDALSRHSDKKREADLLLACRQARWSETSAELEGAIETLSSKLRLDARRDISALADYHLLLGRAHALSGSSARALESLLKASPSLSQEPWKELALNAATREAQDGRLKPKQADALSAAIPEHAAEIKSLLKWSSLLAKPSVNALVELFGSETTVPADYSPQLRRFARRALASARVVNTSDPTLTLAGERLLGLNLSSVIPPPTKIYEALADWVLIANRLQLEEADRLDQIAEDALRCVGVRFDRERSVQRGRLFEATLEARPGARSLMGRYGFAATTLYAEEIQQARETLEELTRGEPGPRRGFWKLWLAYLGAIAPLPLADPGLRETHARAVVSELLTCTAWVETNGANAEVLALLHSDPACHHILSVYQDPRQVYLHGLSRASTTLGDTRGALAYLDRFKLLSTPFPATWKSERILALYGVCVSQDAPPAERTEALTQLKTLLPQALHSAHADHLNRPLDVTWHLRKELPSLRQEHLSAYERYFRDKPVQTHDSLRAAWVAFALGEVERARALVKKAAELLDGSFKNRTDKALANEIFQAHADDDLSLTQIEDFEREVVTRHYVQDREKKP